MAKRGYDVANCPICGGEVRILPDTTGVVRPWILTEPSDPERIIDVTIIPCEPRFHEIKVYRVKPYLPYA